MKFIAIYITNNTMVYGGVQPLCQIVLLVCVLDGNGMRYEKVVNGVKTNYYYDGTQLLMESKNGQRTWYIYGVTGIEGMIVEEGYNESIYYFDKNTLGDIVAIRDSSGNILATYEYDAWGNVTVMDAYGWTNTSSSFIGNINPFRYRGYYYDTETGFYYLQTRYYDPTICRFINADNYELVAELSSVAGQLNMYAYCNNNPIMLTDETGEGILTAILIGLIGAVVGAGFGALTAAAEGENVVAGAIIGGISGGLMAGFQLGFGGTMAISIAANMLNDFINYNRIDYGEAYFEGFLAGVFSGINTKTIGLINNQIISKMANDTLANIFNMTIESIMSNLSRQIAGRIYNPFGFKIGIKKFY